MYVIFKKKFKIVVTFWSDFLLTLFLRVQSTVSKYRFRYWLVAEEPMQAQNSDVHMRQKASMGESHLARMTLSTKNAVSWCAASEFEATRNLWKWIINSIHLCIGRIACAISRPVLFLTTRAAWHDRAPLFRITTLLVSLRWARKV